jgi:hypothetical protein
MAVSIRWVQAAMIVSLLGGRCEAHAATASEPALSARPSVSARGPRPENVELTLLVPRSARLPGLVVTVDGAEVAADQWGVPRAIELGSYTVSAFAPGRRPFVQRLELRSDERVSIPPLEPQCRPGAWWHAGRCEAIPTAPDILFAVADVHAGFWSIARRPRRLDSDGAFMGGTGIRVGNAVPFGFFGALDADAGASVEGQRYLSLNVRVGPARALTRWLLIGLASGGGTTTITGRVPPAFELPLDLVAVGCLHPSFAGRPAVYVEASLRPSWVFGNERRRAASGSRWFDELHAGLHLGAEVQELGEGLPLKVSLASQGSYVEVMGSRGVQFTVGVGGIILYGEDRYEPVRRSY